jgi:hypothetical protein
MASVENIAFAETRLAFAAQGTGNDGVSRTSVYTGITNWSITASAAQLFRKFGVVGLFISLGNFFSGLFPSV